jgi:hypothetical protein
VQGLELTMTLVSDKDGGFAIRASFLFDIKSPPAH